MQVAKLKHSLILRKMEREAAIKKELMELEFQ